MTTSLIIALLLCNMIKYFLAVACVLRSRGVGVIDLETNYTTVYCSNKKNKVHCISLFNSLIEMKKYFIFEPNRPSKAKHYQIKKK